MSRVSLPLSFAKRQRGVVLIVALVLVAIMALVGLNAMRSVTLEERMAGHTYDRSVSFQGAESALREAEALIVLNKPTPAAGACNAGFCPPPSAADVPRWLDTNFNGWQNAAAVDSNGVSVTPQYFVEYLGNTFECEPGNASTAVDCKRYRVTARSNPGADRSTVMLQTIFSTD